MIQLSIALSLYVQVTSAKPHMSPVAIASGLDEYVVGQDSSVDIATES